jgi:putative YhdH/YhfP family quinone oxidoreductase
VIVTSYDLGMNTAGGFAEYIRIPADWVVPCPAGLSLKEAMIYGTAGYTAGLCVEALLKSVKTEDGEILVTGASGGVGSIAVAILVKLGFEVVAASGKTAEKAFFEQLGIKEIISRKDAADSSGRPVLKTRWAGVVDTVGGEILATAVKSAKYNGVVTCCGMVASPDLPLNVFPFILRNVQLLGIDSQNTPMSLRTKVWHHLAQDWKLEHLESLTTEIGLEQLPDYIQQILAGKIKGRTVVKLV